MRNSILIGKVVNQVLASNPKLQELLLLERRGAAQDDNPEYKIYALVADEDTTFPFVIFQRTSVSPSYTKDFYTEDAVGIGVKCVSNNYIQSLQIANEVRHSLEGLRYKDADLTITESKLMGVDEAYTENAFVQVLQFELKIN